MADFLHPSLQRDIKRFCLRYGLNVSHAYHCLLYTSPFSLFLSAVIALMGFSRVWLGQHHPIDIVGGMLLGSIAARCIACERLPMGKEEQQALGEQKIREETGK